MLGLELVVVLGVAVLVGNVVGQRLGIAPPVVLLVTSVLLGFVPAVREAQLPPEVVLLLFLPVLLYWESLTTSLREIRTNLRGILQLSTVLVVLTAWAVAATGHALELPWGPAWVLGAAMAPTDATAVGVLARALPRRQVTILRAESLVNDGTALVVYGLAVGITVGEEHLGIPHVAGLFLLAYCGGAAVGVAVARVNMNLRRHLTDPLLGNLVMILAPFTAYLLAEVVEASGVLAVVVSGLIMSQVAPRIIQAEHRTQALAFWPLAIGSMKAIGLTAFGGPDVLRVLDLLELPTGGTVAVTGAAVAVGGHVVQPAKAEGFRGIADAAPKDQYLVKELGADVVLLRGTDFPELVRKEIPDGGDGLVDTAGIAALAIRAVRDGGRMASSVGGVQMPGERGIQTRSAFVPQYAREHGKLDRLRELTEKGSLTPRVARTLPAEQAPEAHRLLEAGGLRGRVLLTF